MDSGDGATPELHDARRRVGEALERFERIDPEALSLIALPPPDEASRDALKAHVIAAAARTDRLGLLSEAETEARELVFRRFSESGFRPQPFGLNWLQSLGTVPDRAMTGRALLDAVAAAVVEDVLADEVFIDLTAPFEMLVTADLPAAGAVLVGLGGRPTWARTVLMLLAGLAAGVDVLVAAAANAPLYLVFAILPVALVVTVWRTRRPPTPTREDATST